MDARALVAALLEGDEDLDFSMDYVEQARDWHPIYMVTSLEWRKFFRSLGWRVKSLYRHKATAKRRFAFFSMSVEPRDGHDCDQMDASLLAEYIYDFLTKRLGKQERHHLNFKVQSYAWSKSSQSMQPLLRPDENRVDISIVPLSDEVYSDYLYPLNNWPTVRCR